MTFVDAEPGPDGWTAWDDRKSGTRFRMACCGCGLVHEVEMEAGLRLETKQKPTFVSIEGAYVGLRMRRDDAATERQRVIDGYEGITP